MAVRVKVSPKKAAIIAENAFKKDIIGPLSKAAAQAISAAPKDSGRMASAISSRIRKEGNLVVGSIGIFNRSLVEARRRGEKHPRPTRAENLIGITKGRPFLYQRNPRMVFVPKGGIRSSYRGKRRTIIVTDFVRGVPPNRFILRAMDRVARRYNATVRETLH